MNQTSITQFFSISQKPIVAKVEIKPLAEQEKKECSGCRRNDKPYCFDPFYKCTTTFCEWYKP